MSIEGHEEIQQALYYLNNRHRLKMSDMPQYVKSLAIARKHHLEEQNGVWYIPDATTCLKPTCC